MPKVLTYVSDETLVNGQKFYKIDPMISGTGIKDDDFEFIGSVFALDGQGTRPLGERGIFPSLSERRGLMWRVEGGDFPRTPVFITDDEHQSVLLDESIELTFAPGFVRYPPGPSGVVLTGLVLNQFGLILEIKGRPLVKHRIIVVGKDVRLPNGFEVRSTKEPECVVAWAQVVNPR